MATDLRAVTWAGTAIRVIDQTALPGTLSYLEIDDVGALVDAIRRLVVRGAPTLGVVGALGVVIALRHGSREGWDDERVAAEIGRIRAARPTAVNLAWGVDRVAQLLDGGEEAVLAAARELLDETEAANDAIGSNGADWIQDRVGRGPLRVLTHCNTGALATQAWGTALGVVRELHGRGELELVYADETRPLLQGSRLTAWELAREGIAHYVIVDGSRRLGAEQSLVVHGGGNTSAKGELTDHLGRPRRVMWVKGSGSVPPRGSGGRRASPCQAGREPGARRH